MKEVVPTPSPEKKEKPTVLYHATNEREEIKEFEPRRESVRDPEEGPVVFATPDKAYALMFLVPGDDSSSIRGYYNNIPTIVICGTREEFEKRDNGGSVYLLPSGSFDFDSRKKMKMREWTTKESVQPIGREQYFSTINALMDHGVQVYFVNSETFATMRSQENAGYETLRTLTSENMQEGRNIRRYNDKNL